MNPVPPVTNTLIRVRRISLLAIAAVASAGAAAGGVGATTTPAAQPHTFAFAIGNGQLAGGPAQVAERLGGFDLVVVDGEEATAGEVAALQAQSSAVLAYLSVGTIEKRRSWYPRLKPFRLGAWADWKDEWFADVLKRKLRRELVRRVARPTLAKGFDGLFLDNVDMVETRNHRRQRPGMRALVTRLAGLAHGEGKLLFTQNGAWGLRRLGLVGLIDGWNREDVTWTYDFDRHRYVRTPARERRSALDELSAFAAEGKVVTATDYTRANDGRALRESVADSCSVGALPYVSDIGLTARRLPDPPLSCP